MQMFTPKQYMKIDIANSFGLDKLTWDERLAWFDANESQLLNKLSEAESPAMYYAGVKAWEDVKANRATGYPISLDATSSGIQILSVLTGDRKAAVLSNVLPNQEGKRSNAYAALFQAMQARTGNTARFSYEDLKRSIMTAFYGSEKVPKDIFGEGELLGVFFETLEEEAPFVWQLNKAFVKLWNPQALKYSWVLPDNFHVHVKVTDLIQEDVKCMGQMHATYRKVNKPVKEGKSLGANVVHSLDGLIVRELLRRCDFTREQKQAVQELINTGPCGKNPSKNTPMVRTLWEMYEKSGYLSCRILDYLDSTNIHLVDTDPLQDLLDSMPEKPFKILPVHDCFRVHPNYGNDLRKQYNLQLALIAQSNMLSFLLSQILGTTVPVNKQGDFAEEILQADYALS
jgi:hypothetical protein